MIRRLWNRFAYRVERLVVRGAHYRLLVVAAAIGLISAVGGALVLWWGTGHGSFLDAVWWAFLRLTDPGYLGDDVGPVNRTLSTVLTVAGYVLFMGSLVAIMTQWLNARMARLEAGLTPVSRDDHVLVLGWTNRTESLVEELLLSEGRVRRFLRRHGAKDLHIVVLAREVSAARAQDLRDAVGEAWDEHKVSLRSGNAIRMEHLARVDYRNAAAVLVPGSEFETAGAAGGDVRTLKTLLSLASDPPDARPAGEETEELPLVVAELFDGRKAGAARRAYPGDLEVLATDAVFGRLLAQTVRHPGLSEVYGPLLTHGEGAEIYLHEAPELGGRPLEALATAFPGGILLGVVRRGEEGYRTHLNPPAGFRTEAEDRYVVLSDSYEAAAPTGEVDEAPPERGAPGGLGSGVRERRVLLLGWNRRTPALLAEFGSYEGERHAVHVCSTVPEARRRLAIGRHGGLPDAVTVTHAEADFTDPDDLRGLAPADHDAIVMVGSDRLKAEEESDARTVVGSLLLQEMLADGEGEGPTLVMELLDPENLPLVDRSRAEVIITPMLLSHMLAHVALRRELRAVFEDLFAAGGAEITFRPLDAYGLETGAEPTFSAVRRAAAAEGETAIGIRAPGAGIVLAPSDEHRVPTGAATRVVTLVTAG